MDDVRMSRGGIKAKFMVPIPGLNDRMNTFHTFISVADKDFVEALEKTFIDCKILVDPLKTYLIIDWS